MAQNGEWMRAVIMENIGGPRVLNYARREIPEPARGDALVKVHAASVNPADLLLRRGRLVARKPMPHILGGDLAGEIVALGDEVADWAMGDRVCACFEGLGRAIDGAYAEYCVVPADQLAPMPATLDFPTAVAAGASYADAWLALVKRGRLKAGDAVVVLGAATPVGAAAVQIGRDRGAKVIAVCEAEYAGQLRESGADVVLEDASADLARQVKVATDESGAGLVLHCREPLDLPQSLDMLAPGGRLVIACPVFQPAAGLDALDLWLRNLGVIGASGGLSPAELESLLRRVADGELAPAVAAVMPLSQARQAHRKLERKSVFGKIVLVPDAILESGKKPDNWIPID